MRKFFLALSVTAMLFAAGCEKSPGNGTDIRVPEQVLSAFNGMYPDAVDVEWSARGTYWVASFDDAEQTRSAAAAERSEAWYDSAGKWYMTEQDTVRDRLPAAVEEAFAGSAYADWKIDDIDVIRRDGVAVIYVIEVEDVSDGVHREVDLYYSEDGVLVKEVVDSDDDYSGYIPSRPASSVREAVEQKYPGAKITDVEEDDGVIEVEIVDADRIFRELYFSLGMEWLLTKTEMKYSALPEKIRTALESSEYGNMRVDDIDHYLRASGEEYYIFELDSRDDDISVKVTADGTVSRASDDDMDLPMEGGGVSGDFIREFVSGKYPGAVIKEIDEDDGYIKAEILHDGLEKEVYFNGKPEWVRTEWDVRYGMLPDAVKNTLAGWREIDDITYVETPDAVYYEAEVEDNDRDRIVRVLPDGTLMQ